MTGHHTTSFGRAVGRIERGVRSHSLCSFLLSEEKAVSGGRYLREAGCGGVGSGRVAGIFSTLVK